MTATTINFSTVGADRTAQIAARVRRDLGPQAVSTDPAKIERLSVDWARMSPILAERLPAGRADLVVTPTSALDVPVVLAHAYELDVPITPRGTGLGNYGQAIPLRGGILLDLSACRALVELGDGWATAEAGIRMRDLDAAAAASGQELTIYPSTKGSSLGGFLARGSGGTGSIDYGTNAVGFLHALDVAPCDGSGSLVHVTGPATLPYIHAYGTSGIICRATVALAPQHAWAGVYGAFDSYPDATAAMAEIVRIRPVPRLISLDDAGIVEALPADEALDPARLSLRVIADETTVAAVRDVMTANGGEVTAVRSGEQGADRLTSLSYNHSTFHLQRKVPGYFHLEAAGQVLVDDVAAVRAVYPGTLLHLEQFADRVGGMIMAKYESAEQVYAGMRALEDLGVSLHSPHTWMLERRLDGVVSVLDRMDPRGLLNPGKLPARAGAPYSRPQT